MTDILNLPGLRVLDVHETESQYLILVGTSDSRAEPCCLFHATETRRNGTKRQVFRDLTTHDKFVEIAIDRQRFHCKHCGKTTYEQVPHLNTDHRMTDRLVTVIGNSAIKETFTAVAQRMGLSEGTVRGVFRARVNQVLASRSIVTPRILGMDEKHLLKGYRCVIGNIEQRTLIDILPTRFIGPRIITLMTWNGEFTLFNETSQPNGWTT